MSSDSIWAPSNRSKLVPTPTPNPNPNPNPNSNPRTPSSNPNGSTSTPTRTSDQGGQSQTQTRSQRRANASNAASGSGSGLGSGSGSGSPAGSSTRGVGGAGGGAGSGRGRGSGGGGSVRGRGANQAPHPHTPQSQGLRSAEELPPATGWGTPDFAKNLAQQEDFSAPGMGMGMGNSWSGHFAVMRDESEGYLPIRKGGRIGGSPGRGRGAAGGLGQGGMNARMNERETKAIKERKRREVWKSIWGDDDDEVGGAGGESSTGMGGGASGSGSRGRDEAGNMFVQDLGEIEGLGRDGREVEGVGVGIGIEGEVKLREKNGKIQQRIVAPPKVRQPTSVGVKVEEDEMAETETVSDTIISSDWPESDTASNADTDDTITAASTRAQPDIPSSRPINSTPKTSAKEEEKEDEEEDIYAEKAKESGRNLGDSIWAPKNRSVGSGSAGSVSTGRWGQRAGGSGSSARAGAGTGAGAGVGVKYPPINPPWTKEVRDSLPVLDAATAATGSGGPASGGSVAAAVASGDGDGRKSWAERKKEEGTVGTSSQALQAPPTVSSNDTAEQDSPAQTSLAPVPEQFSSSSNPPPSAASPATELTNAPPSPPNEDHAFHPSGGGMDWADDDDDDDGALDMQNVMAEWGIKVPGAGGEANESEGKAVGSVEKPVEQEKAQGKGSLLDRLGPVPAKTERKESIDLLPPGEVMSPATPAETSIWTPAATTKDPSDHVHDSAPATLKSPLNKSEDLLKSPPLKSAQPRKDDPPNTQYSPRKPRTERPRLALADDRLKRMTGGLLGGAGGRAARGNGAAGARAKETQ